MTLGFCLRRKGRVTWLSDSTSKVKEKMNPRSAVTNLCCRRPVLNAKRKRLVPMKVLLGPPLTSFGLFSTASPISFPTTFPFLIYKKKRLCEGNDRAGARPMGKTMNFQHKNHNGKFIIFPRPSRFFPNRSGFLSYTNGHVFISGGAGVA